MQDDTEKVSSLKTCNLNELFEQALSFAQSHYWHKVKNPLILYAFLEPSVPSSFTLILYSFDERDGMLHIHWPENRRNNQELGSLDMQSSSKYPITITRKIGCHQFANFGRGFSARYTFDKYLWYLKIKGLAKQNDVNLPSFVEKTMGIIPKSIAVPPASFSKFAHEKWRMIGEIVNAARSVAADCGIEINEEQPYPPESEMWDYMDT